MISVEQFKAEHLREIEPQAWQRDLYKQRSGETGRLFEEAGNAYTLRHNGRIVACAGLVASEIAAVELWAVIAERAPLVVLHRAAQRLLELYRGCGRISARAEIDFPQGCRWLEMLGFKRLPAVVTGHDFGLVQALYAREL